MSLPSWDEGRLGQLLLGVARCFLPVLFMSCLMDLAFFTRMRIIGNIAVIRSRPFGGKATRRRSAIRLVRVRFLSRLAASNTTIVFTLSLFVPFLLYLLFNHPRRARSRTPCRKIVTLQTPPTVHFSIV